MGPHANSEVRKKKDEKPSQAHILLDNSHGIGRGKSGGGVQPEPADDTG